MRIFRFLTLLLLGPMLMRNASVKGRDIVIVLDPAAGAHSNAPWMDYPCMDPAHFYLRPAAVDDESGATYPAAATNEADEGEELRFSQRFLNEEGARGFRPWNWHFERGGDGEPRRIENCEGQRAAACRAIAEELVRLLLAGAENRVAICAMGPSGDERFSINFTRDEEKLLNLIDAIPEAPQLDRSTALEKAMSYISRRSNGDFCSREAVVVIISGAESDAEVYEARAKERAEALINEARVVFVSVMNEKDALAGLLEGAGAARVDHDFYMDERATAMEAAALVRLPEEAMAPRRPIYRRAGERAKANRAR